MQSKKNQFLKKISIFLINFLMFFCFTVFSCSKKNSANEKVLNAEAEKSLRDFIFEDISRLLKTEKKLNENDDFFYLKKFLSYRYFENGLTFYYFEKYFPEYQGVFESTGFYVSEFETTTWLEDLILQTEEERIADEITLLEEVANENSDIFEEKNDEIEKIIKSEEMQKEFTDKNGNLIFMEFEQERFIPQKTENGYLIIHSQNNQVTKKLYNFDFRLESVEKRNIKQSTLHEEQKPDFVQKYFYDEETQNVNKTETTEASQKIISFYDENKKLTKKQVYTIQNEQIYVVFENNIKYDENLNIKENQSIEYFYNEDFSEQTGTFTKKYIYTQNQEEIPPDFEYYEDDILKMRNKYSSEKGTYTSQIFFEDGLSVKIYYQNDKKKKEVYFADETILKVKNYEN